MTAAASAARPPPPDARKLTLATLAALGIAALVLVAAVLPAEYGIDSTGVGGALGLTGLRGTAPAASNDTADPSGRAPDATTQSITFRTFASSYSFPVAQVLAKEGYLAEGRTLLVPFELADANATFVAARLDFVDANATPTGAKTRPDLFEVELKAPNGDVSGAVLGRSDPTTGGGSARVVFSIRAPPAGRSIEATSEAEARDAFVKGDADSARLQTGAWTARVTMVEAGDADAAQGVALPGAGGTPTADEGNSWTLTITVGSFEVAVTEKPGTRQRADSVTIVLPPGGEAEYKLRVDYGKRVDYAWRSDGAGVYYDFHGDREGDASGAFTRHKSGNAVDDAGTLVSPFDGRHGWYWRNGTPKAVTITLDTRGQYDIIGRTL